MQTPYLKKPSANPNPDLNPTTTPHPQTPRHHHYNNKNNRSQTHASSPANNPMTSPYTPRGGRGRSWGGGPGSGRGRGGGNSSFTPASMRGKFQDNMWHCDCPSGETTAGRLPAERNRVRKDTPNKGKFFYGCQRYKEENACGFFLWEEEAKAREAEAMLRAGEAALRAEEAELRVRGARGARDPPPPYREGEASTSAPAGAAGTSATTTAAAVGAGVAAKRKFQEEVDGAGVGEDDETEDEDDEFGWRESFGVEREIGRVMGDVGGSNNGAGHAKPVPPPPQPPLITPRKAMKGSLFATPGRSSMVTPVSHRGNGSGAAASSSKATDATPTLSRLTMTPSGADGSGGDDVGDSLVPEVTQLLQKRGVRLDRETDEALQKTLSRHALHMQGLARGRTISRLALKERNAKIDELQARITALEAELETQKAVISNLNWQRETGQFD